MFFEKTVGKNQSLLGKGMLQGLYQLMCDFMIYIRNASDVSGVLPMFAKNQPSTSRISGVMKL